MFYFADNFVVISNDQHVMNLDKIATSTLINIKYEDFIPTQIVKTTIIIPLLYHCYKILHRTPSLPT